MRLVLRVLATIYLAYLSISALLLLPALNFAPAWYVKQAFGRDLQSDIILFNPFTLSLQLRGVSLPELDGEPFVSLERATVDLSTETLWQPGWIFDEVSVRGLYAHLRQLPDGNFNFSDMVPPGEDTAPGSTDEPAAIPGLTIHEFAFQSHRIAYSNEAREEPYRTHVDDLDIEVSDISTILEEGRPYRIDARGEGGSSLHWEGEVSIPRSNSEGELRLSGVELRSLWRFAEPWLNFELKDGKLEAQAAYSVDWQDELAYRVDGGEVRISGVDLQPASGLSLADTALGLAEFAITGIDVDGPAQRLEVDAITIDGLSVDGWMEDSRLSLAELFAVDLPPAEETAETEDDGAGEESGWTAALAAVRLQNSRLGWRSGFTDPPQLEVSPITAGIDNVSWPLQGDTSVSLNLGVNDQVSLETGGTIDLGSGDASFEYRLQGLPIPWANPNLPKALNAVITDGFIEVEGGVTLAAFEPATAHTNGEITDFSGRLTDTEESITSLKSMRWEGLAVDLVQRSVAMNQLTIQQYVGRLHIKKDGSINAQNIIQEEVGDKAEEIAEEIAEELELDEPWSVRLPSVQVAESQIDFMDESLPIVFRTVIGGLYGQVSGVSTEPGDVAEIHLKGSVDGYAPVVLAGTAEPFRSPPALDLNLSFSGVDMALLTPYSGTYAGYAIERGLLDLDLKYALQENRLEGHNSVRIDQMKLGKKVESDKAADLPLELAVALLSDANGVIDLQVPVSGDVDDPEFDIGAVIAGTVMNIITKAVTAPFKLLAGLVGSEEDLQRLNFANGTAELDARGREKLGQLAAAMEQRPALNLVIAGRLNVEADRERLQQLTLRQQLLDEGLPESALEVRDKAWASAIDKRYQALGLPETGTDGNSVPLPERFDQVVRNVAVSDADLRELAEARAVAVKSFLVNEAGLDPGRAVIEQTSPEDEANMFSGVELSAGA